MEIYTLSNIGLIVDFIAAVLIFLYGFPVSIDFGGINQKAQPRTTKSHYLAKIGFSLLAIGFAMQLLGNLGIKI